VPSHTYTYSWEPKSDWSAVYAGSKEIQGYFKDFATKHNLWQYIQVNHEIVRAEWQDTPGEWSVEVRDTVSGEVTEHRCDIFINGSGILNNWRWPDIPGLDHFQGKLLHSAHYEDGYDLSGKRVGLIGNG
jgi:cation diffusion facilitator CzcD-associated flavoprotein CzcO